MRTFVAPFACGLALALVAGCRHADFASARSGSPVTPRLFAALPDFCPTPDGMAIAPDGDLVVACPNFADQSKPACLLRIGKEKIPWLWVAVPPHPETGVACPMGIEFGPDGDLYVCDNQGLKGDERGRFKSRILRLRVKGTEIESCTVVAEGMEFPNGIRIRDGHVYVTESRMTKAQVPYGPCVSGVYRFRLEDRGVQVVNTLDDPNLVAAFTNQNEHLPIGADGLVFDKVGNLFVGVLGDGAIYKLAFGALGKVTSKTLFARTDFDARLSPKSPGFLAVARQAKMRTAGGMCMDPLGNIYVADSANNAIALVSPEGRLNIIAQNGDTDGTRGELDQPGELIIWNNRLVVSCFDSSPGESIVNKINDAPFTLSEIELVPWK